MAISNEFAQAVSSRNILRVKIMLKDSLVYDSDPTFPQFEEMQKYAIAHGLNPWADADASLERKEKPWSEDTLNAQLAALVCDFTKERVNYIKEIKSDLYKPSLNLVNNRTKNCPTSQVGSKAAKRSRIKGSDDYHEIIKTDSRKIRKILQENILATTTRKETWLNEDIEEIQNLAKNIYLACDRILKRR